MREDYKWGRRMREDHIKRLAGEERITFNGGRERAGFTFNGDRERAGFTFNGGREKGGFTFNVRRESGGTCPDILILAA